MRAVIQRRYGTGADLDVQHVDVPEVADDEVLVRVRAASVHPDVWHVVTGHPYALRLMGNGVLRPRLPVPGTDVAGVVARVGASVTRFAPGDEVFGETLRSLQWRNGGAYAEFVSVPEDNLATKPERLSFEQAACLPTAGLIVLLNLPDGLLRPGSRVLVNGAAGGVGSIAVQVAAAYGAAVTGVDEAGKLDLLGELGATEVIDHTRQDFTRSDARYDLVFDIPGNRRFRDIRRVLAEDGTYVLIGHDGFGASAGRWLGSMPRLLGLVARAPFTRQLPRPSFASPAKQESMATLRELAETGQLTAVIDTAYSLDEVPQALARLERGDVRGRLVIIPGAAY